MEKSEIESGNPNFRSATIMENAGKSTPAEEKITGDSKRNRILVMDDDILIRTVTENLLKKAGFDVTIAVNGKEAIDFYKSAYINNPFSVVFIDLSIPDGLDGTETIKALKNFDPDAKAIVFSGYSNDPIVTEYKSYGFDGVLTKPFTNNELKSVLSSVLDTI